MRYVAKMPASIAIGLAIFGAVACGGTAKPQTAQAADDLLALAISQYTRMSSGEADDVARLLAGSSDDGLRALARTVDQQPALPSATAISDDLANLGRSEGFDGAAALDEFCSAIVSALSPSLEIETNESGQLVTYFADADPARTLYPELAAAATRVLTSSYGVGGYTKLLLDRLTDSYWQEATAGITPSTGTVNPQNALLWLRLQQVKAAAC